LLRKKLKVVDALARHRIQNAPPGTLHVLDALIFPSDGRGSTPYSRVPAELLRPFYSLLLLAFFHYLGISYAPFLSITGSETSDFWAIGHGILITLVGTFVYSWHVSKSLEAQAYNVVGCVPEELQSPLANLKRRLASWWHSHRISESWSSFPRAYLLSGSLLILLTLGLAMTLNSCGDTYKGYEFAQGKAPWVGAEEFASTKGLEYSINQNLGVRAYRAALLLSVVSLGLLMISSRRPMLLSNRRLVGGAFIVTTAIASFVLSQLSFAPTMGSDAPGAPILSWLWAVYWVACSLVWARFAIAAIRKGGLRWPSRSLPLFLYFSQITAFMSLAIVSILGAPRPWGLPAYFFGIHLVAVAYALYLVRACQPDAAGPRAL